MARKFETNRKTYEKIKKSDNEQFKNFVNDVYEKGYAAGQQDADHFDTELALKSISEIKGIGPEKLKQIRLAMMAAGAKDPAI